jgi:hypothetical protein
MNTHHMQGSFITLIWTLIAKLKEVTTANSVSIPPRAGMVADLLLRPIMSRTMQRRLAEDASLNHRVYRFSSVDKATLLCWSSSCSKLSPR